jgi:archaetidylinositol phosphate synthase
MSEPNPKMPVRNFTGWSADAEKALLIRVARRLPAVVTPNVMTGVGFLGGVLVGVSYAASHVSPVLLWLAVFGFAVNWFGDSLDGTLARVRGTERPRFGMFVDQTVDIAAVFCMLLGMGLSDWARMDVALGAFATYLLLAVMVHLKASVTGIYDIALGGVGPTEGRAIMAACTATLPFQSPVPLLSPAPGIDIVGMDLVLLVMIVWGVIAVGQAFIVNARKLALQEPNRNRR